ncbi:hypothetical protein HY627_02100 [Candidatus Uhrbacteria bacterium]|nr:hypothetical protein [Candidatus Uhrbacteria bacterium]
MEHSIFKRIKTPLFVLLSLGVAGGFSFILYQSVHAEWSAPNCQPPDCQPEGGGGAGVGTFFELLKSNARAQMFGADQDGEISHVENDGNGDYTVNRGTISIGGAMNADGSSKSGPVYFGLGTSTPGYPLDVVSQKDDLTKDTAVARLGYSSGDKVYTGLRLDRNAGDEKWFIGMDNQTDNLVAKSKENGVGANCLGAILVGLSQTPFTADPDGYKAANQKCSSKYTGSHVCTTEDMFRTQVCKQEKFGERGIVSEYPWVSNGPSSDPDIVANDCDGWKSNDDTAYGGIWEMSDTGGTPLLSTCGFTAGKFACCK